ncbi:hypothetical protein D9619_005756 [Psilocybe cf. subviscida]|uniref:DNA 5'-3' helicase n=1 Tax=Psilocybe cf. subviscida TaxID=2480587 RepID=A0A8H5BW92_9AGAR|nr:hypothetical protein D9619_005756 [Psilocybe cf. subviscida]
MEIKCCPSGYRALCSLDFVGTNAYWLPTLNSDQDIDSTLGNMSALGIKVVRTWAFNDVDTIPPNGTWFQLIANGTTTINTGPNGLQKLDTVLRLAQKHNIFVLLSLTNNWNPRPLLDNTTAVPAGVSIQGRDVTTGTDNTLPRNTLSNDFGGMDAYVREFGNGTTHDEFYTNPTILAQFLNYTTTIVSRYKDSTSVFSWEVANDPRCASSLATSSSCNTQTITKFHDMVSTQIKKVDPNHLVSSGSQGFLCHSCAKIFPRVVPPPPQTSPTPNGRRSITKAKRLQKMVRDERKEIRNKIRTLNKRNAEAAGSGIRIRGRWMSTPTVHKRQSDDNIDQGSGSAFDGSQGVDSEDILNAPNIGFGTFQLFPDQNSYGVDDPTLPAFNNTVNQGLAWIKQHAAIGQLFGKPVTLNGFGLVTQSNAPFFVPFNTSVAPFGPDAANATAQQPFGVTDQQRNDAYSQWLQAGLQAGLQGMLQYQGTSITANVNGTDVSNNVEGTGLSPNDGYAIQGVGMIPTTNSLNHLTEGTSEQYAYMCDLKRTLDATGHCVLEMPSGTGKTVSLLSLIVSYQQFFPTKRKLIYCSRTVPEIEKALTELKRLMDYRIKMAETEEEKEKESTFMGLGLTSRKNLCINPEIFKVVKEKKGKVVDARCRDLTNSVACEKGRADPGSVELCDWHENLGKMEPGSLIPPGIWTLADVLEYGREKGVCPYFAVRRMVAEQVSKEMSKDAIVVFDEAHNIDNVCIESLSIDLTRPMMDAAGRSVTKLADKIEEIKTTDAAKLQDEYAKLVEGLQESISDQNDTDGFMGNPLLPNDLLNEAIPGNIRKAEHFVAFLKRFVEYIKSLIRTLELTRLDEYASLQKVAAFATLVATYEKGFLLILEPFETDNATVPNPVFHFTFVHPLTPNLQHVTDRDSSCLDPSLAIQPVFERFSSVVITSGTLSPLDMYPKMLQFTPVVQETYPMTLTRNAFLPLVITRGSDQVAISSRFEVRNDPAVVRNFGSILIEYSKTVPDGVVAFFPSYLYMESIVAAWNDMGILNEVWKHKLIFVETPDANETSIALENYRRACDNGRGAVLLSVARGKVSEGIDFDHNYGRAVIMFGVPYQYTESRILKARLEYLRDAYRIRESEFLGFDAMRNAAQCVGRVLRGKTDWGLMIFADKRFARADKRAKLPRWINQYITETASNLSTDMAITLSKLFMRTISQNPNENQTGISLWTLEDIEKAQAKQKELMAIEAERRQDDDEYGDGGISDSALMDFDLDV